LTTLVDGKAYFALTLINKEPREIILSSALLFASLAIPAPLASAHQRGYNPANLAFDSIYNSVPYLCSDYNQNTGNCDRVEFSHDNIGEGTPNSNCYGTGSNACSPNSGAGACAKQGNPECGPESPATLGNKPGEDSKNQPSVERLRGSKPADFNRHIYYKNKLEFSLEGGWLPANIPFPLDVFEGDPYKLYPLRYTLVPIIASLRWHMDDVGGPRILRGNWGLACSGSFTAIPRGPETRYFAYIMGIRRNFVPRNWRATPYFDLRLGLGDIDAKGPKVAYAQGQDFTFTAQMGSGVRYNFNPRYAISAGMNYMHISNAGLSGKKNNYGINVYGPMFGIDIQLRRQQRHSEQ
jgi:Lipid A 3-O-deacylase (PagL)